MKHLLRATAAIEAWAGIALLGMPVLSTRVLLELPLQGTAALCLARIGGAALLALGCACWLASFDAASCAARGLVSGMVLYNVGAAFILGSTGLTMDSASVVLWLAVALHAGMSAWCLAALFLGRTPVSSQPH